MLIPPAKNPRPKKIRKTGTDPLVSEEMIVDCLSVESDGDQPGILQTGAMMAILDAFDRGVERDGFIPILYTGLNLHTSVGRLTTLRSAMQLMDSNQLSVESLSDALRQMEQYATSQKVALKSLVDRLVQCPRAADPIS